MATLMARRHWRPSAISRSFPTVSLLTPACKPSFLTSVNSISSSLCRWDVRHFSRDRERRPRPVAAAPVERKVYGEKWYEENEKDFATTEEDEDVEFEEEKVSSRDVFEEFRGPLQDNALDEPDEIDWYGAEGTEPALDELHTDKSLVLFPPAADQKARLFEKLGVDESDPPPYEGETRLNPKALEYLKFQVQTDDAEAFIRSPFLEHQHVDFSAGNFEKEFEIEVKRTWKSPALEETHATRVRSRKIWLKTSIRSLQLNSIEEEIFRELVQKRASGDELIIVADEFPTPEENEQRCYELLTKLISAAQNLAVTRPWEKPADQIDPLLVGPALPPKRVRNVA